MKRGDCSSGHRRPPTDFWMRSVCFAGLHRVLKAVAEFPSGLTASDLNGLIAEDRLVLSRRNSLPAPTTLYHYRNTLLHIDALRRNGRMLRVNVDDPDVSALLRQPAPNTTDQTLRAAAIDPFAALVLRNRECRSLFFDLFMPFRATPSVGAFRQQGSPVEWIRYASSGTKEVVFRNRATGRKVHCSSHASVAAVLYGLRYWARDELNLIDEYSHRSDGATVMFPVSLSIANDSAIDCAVKQMMSLILSLRGSRDWTLFAISDLISQCCEARRLPLQVLFRAIEGLFREWPDHTMAIPTSRALATLTATSPQGDGLALRGFYKSADGPYISHIRVHRDIPSLSMEATTP